MLLGFGNACPFPLTIDEPRDRREFSLLLRLRIRALSSSLFATYIPNPASAMSNIARHRSPSAPSRYMAMLVQWTHQGVAAGAARLQQFSNLVGRHGQPYLAGGRRDGLDVGNSLSRSYDYDYAASGGRPQDQSVTAPTTGETRPSTHSALLQGITNQSSSRYPAPAGPQVPLASSHAQRIYDRHWPTSSSSSSSSSPLMHRAATSSVAPASDEQRGRWDATIIGLTGSRFGEAATASPLTSTAQSLARYSASAGLGREGAGGARARVGAEIGGRDPRGNNTLVTSAEIRQCLARADELCRH